MASIRIMHSLVKRGKISKCNYILSNEYTKRNGFSIHPLKIITKMGDRLFCIEDDCKIDQAINLKNKKSRTL